jgi:hypothetical protein
MCYELLKQRIKELTKNNTWKGSSSPLHSASMEQSSRGKNRAAGNKAGKLRPSRGERG